MDGTSLTLTHTAIGVSWDQSWKGKNRLLKMSEIEQTTFFLVKVLETPSVENSLQTFLLHVLPL